MLYFKTFDKMHFNKHLFCSYPTYLIIFMVIILSGSAPGRINSTDPSKLNEYPNYIWVFVHHHVTAQLGELVAIILFVKKYEILRKHIYDNCMTVDESIIDFSVKMKGSIFGN